MKPCGWKILIKAYEGSDRTAGGILLPDQTKDMARLAATCCEVIAIGPLAYADPAKFEEPWCKVGDWVLIGKFSGSRIMFKDVEHRFINDDEVMGIVDDPNDVSRV